MSYWVPLSRLGTHPRCRLQRPSLPRAEVPFALACYISHILNTLLHLICKAKGADSAAHQRICLRIANKLIAYWTPRLALQWLSSVRYALKSYSDTQTMHSTCLPVWSWSFNLLPSPSSRPAMGGRELRDRMRLKRPKTLSVKNPNCLFNLGSSGSQFTASAWGFASFSLQVYCDALAAR